MKPMEDNLMEKETILCLYPNRYGFAYTLFESPEKILDVGLKYIQPASNKENLKKIREYIEYYKPSVIINRNIADAPKRSSKRIAKLLDQITEEVLSQELKIKSYTRTDIKETFLQFGANTKYEIKQKILYWFPKLNYYDYPPRLEWEGEQPQSHIFDAVSLAACYFYLG